MEGCDFSYNGKYLRDFGFIMVKPDTSDNSGLSRELLKSTTKASKEYAKLLFSPFESSAVTYSLL